mgnify:CR=1 FL=1
MALSLATTKPFMGGSRTLWLMSLMDSACLKDSLRRKLEETSTKLDVEDAFIVALNNAHEDESLITSERLKKKTKGKEFRKKNVRLKTIGRTHLLPNSCRQELAKVIKETSSNTKLTVVLALSYGSREEITDATRRIAEKAAQGEIDPKQIHENTIVEHLDTSEFPDPDFLIRTSGELRLSNFLLWQLSYAEIFITEKNWPDFRKSDFHEALEIYSRRRRRFGRL